MPPCGGSTSIPDERRKTLDLFWNFCRKEKDFVPFQIGFRSLAADCAKIPDTVLLTIIFFSLCFAITGLFQVRAIRKVKIIDMLHADRENEDMSNSGKWINRIIILNLILHFCINPNLGEIQTFCCKSLI